MNDNQHLHIIAICRKCGGRDMFPLGDISEVREYIRQTPRIADDEDGVTFVEKSRNNDDTLIEFTLSKGDKSHDYIVTYRYCDENIATCIMLSMIQLAAAKAGDAIMGISSEPVNPDKPPFMGFQLPKDNYKAGNN